MIQQQHKKCVKVANSNRLCIIHNTDSRCTMIEDNLQHGNRGTGTGITVTGPAGLQTTLQQLGQWSPGSRAGLPGRRRNSRPKAYENYRSPKAVLECGIT